MPEPTVAQRIVRAKRKIEEARIPYEVPDRSRMPERLDVVLNVIYWCSQKATAQPPETT